ncbi:FecCD family ABC transporter permease [Rhodovibrio salinarum]|uniref:FecCD family ABC transporter permease n=1 Tax=Rhodovibrio salinarum TaxID=1087 RepID=UPI0004BBC9DE|nr:iron ABC transporter permease [Rhodovibrio salinarum]
MVRYRAQVKRHAVVLIALAGASALAFVTDVATGPSNMNPLDVVRAILAPDSVARTVQVIVWDVRLPYAVMALLVGGALSLAGAEMQTILDNPLASPFTLGVSSAASFGAAVAIVLGLGLPGVADDWIISGNAFVFAFGSVLLLQALAQARGSGVQTLILFGIALVFTFNALVALLQFVASQEALQQLVFWSMGSLARANWQKLQVLAVIVAVMLPWSFASAWTMTALRLGEDRARSFGIRVGRLRFLSLLRVSILAATAVAFVGTISFIGLVGPHIARLLVGEDHRFLLPASLFSGALVLSLASVASKTIVPGALLPVGIVTALIGIPFFVVLIYLRREQG